MLNTVTYLPKLKEFEGSIPHMYLDTTGNVTVGVGNMLPDADAAVQLAFQRRAGDGPAAAEEIRADFSNVARQPAAREAAYYLQFTQLDLPEAAIDALLATRVTDFTSRLTVKFPEFALYPDPVSAALFDMAFNLGLGKLTGEFLHFCAAVRAKDWATAATECARHGICDARNAWTKAQFLQVASDTHAAGAGI